MHKIPRTSTARRILWDEEPRRNLPDRPVPRLNSEAAESPSLQEGGGGLVQAALVRTAPKVPPKPAGAGWTHSCGLPCQNASLHRGAGVGPSPSQTHEGAANYGRWGRGGGPYPVCPSSGQGRKAALLGLSSATEGQLKHWTDNDSKGSLPFGLKLFAQLRHGPGRALSLWAGLATPRVPCSLRVEPGLRAALIPHPPGISLYCTAPNTVAATHGSATRR